MKYKQLAVYSLMSVLTLTACSGDDGEKGEKGDTGATGAAGLNTLVKTVELPKMHSHCFAGGSSFLQGLDSNRNGALDDDEIQSQTYQCAPSLPTNSWNFNRIASFPVCLQHHDHCDTDAETSAEIIAVSTDTNTLIYSDSPGEAVGFIDITDPAAPVAAGILAVQGEPTSVAVKGAYALVAVNTSADYINVSGVLRVVDIATQQVVRSIDLGGQPDSVAVSPDGHYAAIAIENERDEELGDGKPPQLPAGSLVSLNISDASPENWIATTVDVTGLAELFPADPEPEYVDINENNIAVVTLQENNHILLVDLASATVVDHFSAGSVDLTWIDTEEEDPAVINQVSSLNQVPREPDGVTWINTEYFATADEGDMDGGSRGFTVFNTSGEVVWSSGSTLDHMAARFGHYPDSRSGNKGNEPENIELGIFGGNRYLFVNSERSSLVFVYDVADPKAPVFKQVLPAAKAPEGGLAIPGRNLLVVASEEDSRGDKMRSTVNIYQYNTWAAQYPAIASVNRANGTPIPWSALSGLSADPWHDDLLYAVDDSYYGPSRLFTIDVSTQPAVITKEQIIRDSKGVFAAVPTASAAVSATAFDDVDKAALINADHSLNLDSEGIARAADGGFWLVSEGSGTVSDAARPVNSLDFLLKLSSDAVVEAVYLLPAEVNALQMRFGFEGVTEHNGTVYVAFQRAWEGEDNPRIGMLDVQTGEWSFVYYPLDAVASQYGGWVGVSDITATGDGRLLVLERDNQGGPDAAIKRIYSFDPSAHAAGTVVTKTLVRDLMASGDLTATGGLVPEKIEGMALMRNGDIFIVNDNDGVDDNSGETQLINLGALL